MDHLTPERRSWNMSRIPNKNTKPELLVRSLLHRAGYRFTVNGRKNKSLPGRPDIVLPKFKAVVFVHGCYWHRHRNCKYAYTPKSRVEFWEAKFDANVKRDRRNQRDLKRLGWKVIVIWECQTRTQSQLNRILTHIVFRLKA